MIKEKCDCVVSTKGGKPHPAEPDKQPTVELHPSIDERFYVGTCKKCKKVTAKKI